MVKVGRGRMSNRCSCKFIVVVFSFPPPYYCTVHVIMSWLSGVYFNDSHGWLQTVREVSLETNGRLRFWGVRMLNSLEITTNICLCIALLCLERKAIYLALACERCCWSERKRRSKSYFYNLITGNLLFIRITYRLSAPSTPLCCFNVV